MSIPKALLDFIERSDLIACIDFMADFNARERRTWFPEIKKLLAETWNNHLSGQNCKACIDSASMVFLASAPLTEIKKKFMGVVPLDKGVLLHFVQEIKPDWLQEWADFLLDQVPHFFSWYYEMMKKGFIQTKKSDALVLGLISSSYFVRDPQKPIFDPTDSFLLECVWDIFRIEGNSEVSLSSLDKYTHKENNWCQTIIQLSREGRLDRARLLKCSLEALRLDFKQFRAGWFSRFHESLKPTMQERMELQSLYIQLMGSQIPPTVSFAFKALKIIHKKRPIPAELLVPAISDLIFGQGKKLALEAYRLLEGSNLQPILLAETMVQGFMSPHAEVQEKVLEWFQKHGLLPQFSSEIEGYLDSCVPSVQKALSEILGAPTTLAEAQPIERDENREVVPYGHAVEVIEGFLHFFENPVDPMKVEKLCDGVLRFSPNDENTESLLKPLRKRITDLQKRRGSWLTRDLILDLAQSWIEGKVSIEKISSWTWQPLRILDQRIEEVAKNIGKTPVLLGFPTESSGWIHPDEFAKRLIRLKEKNCHPTELESAIAILRLDVSQKPTFRILELPETELSDAFRYAMGENITVGNQKALWVAASRARFGGELDPNLKSKWPENLPYVWSKPHIHYYIEKEEQWKTLKWGIHPNFNPPDFLHLQAFLLSDSWFYGSRYDWASINWISSLFPNDLEPFAFDACKYVGELYDFKPLTAFLEPYFHSRKKLGELAHLLIVLSLAHHEGELWRLACDLLQKASQENRIERDLLVHHMVNLWPTGFIHLPRWNRSFEHLASFSMETSRFCFEVLQDVIFFEEMPTPNGLSGLLQLIYQLSIQNGLTITSPGLIDFLNRKKATGNLKKVIQKLKSRVE